jgi:hypothetical protein
MAIQIDVRGVHHVVQKTKEFADFYSRKQRELCSLPVNTMYCIHELGHEMYLKEAGIGILEYLGPRIAFDFRTGRLGFTPASVIPDYRNAAPEAGLSIEEFFLRVAKGHAAGGVFTLILTDSPDPRNESDYPEFEKYCSLIESEIPETTIDHKGLWDQSEIDVARDLRFMLNRSRIWEGVSKIRPKLFPPVKS